MVFEGRIELTRVLLVGQIPTPDGLSNINMVGRVGFEPTTLSLKGSCSSR